MLRPYYPYIIAKLNLLGLRLNPLYGQLSLWAVLLTSVYVSLETNLLFQYLPKNITVSVIGYLLPAQFLNEPFFFHACRNLFWFSAALWAAVPFLGGLGQRALRVIIPVSAWTTYLAYTITASLYWENLPWIYHKFVLPSWLLLIHALWCQFYLNEISTSLSNRTYWNTPLYPFWVRFLSVYFIAIFYTFSGASKLLSTMNWADGLSLQLWTQLFGNHNSFFGKLILSDRLLAAILQKGALALECLSFTAMFNIWSRMAIGMGLLILHFVIDVTLNIDFRAHMILIAVYFLPLFEFTQRQASMHNEAAAENH